MVCQDPGVVITSALLSETVLSPLLIINKWCLHANDRYLLFQGFDAPAIVSQKRPVLPKAKRDEDPIPVAILQIEDSDLLNFMSGGLTVSLKDIQPYPIPLEGCTRLLAKVFFLLSQMKQ